MEDLVCPECNAPLKEEDLKKSLVCPNCKTNLRDSKYLDFLELLVYYDIIDDIDFFDMSLYGKEMLEREHEDFDEEEIDPSKFEKKKEVWDEFEDDLELNENLAEEIESSEDAFEDEWDEDNEDREEGEY
jgi:uncharacterized protein YbaR (Trm112 family)